MVGSSLIRIVAAAFALSTLSFAAGVAGDLSTPRPASGTRVVLAIPPEAPAIAMPSLPRTAAAEARPRIIRPARAEQLVGASEAPPTSAIDVAALLPRDHEMCHSEPTPRPESAWKGEPRKLS
ncbi:MAG: hypothetical protein ABL864_05125 [Terricaulis sp.]